MCIDTPGTTRQKPLILVTGGCGYIGSHTVLELLYQDYEVVLVDSLTRSSSSVLTSIKQLTGVLPRLEVVDLCDREALKYALDRIGRTPDGVIHFAAFKAVEESVREPLLYYRNNIMSMINVLEEMKERKCPALVFSSSCTVYGQPKPEQLPVTEDTPIVAAQSPYGNTKQICEEIIRDTLCSIAHKNKPPPSPPPPSPPQQQLPLGLPSPSQAPSRPASQPPQSPFPSKGDGCFEMRAICLRYFNPVGADESGCLGELPLGTPQNLMPYITQTAAGFRPLLQIFGHDYPHTPDGTCIRDYIHVTDLAQAHLAALRRLFHLQTRPMRQPRSEEEELLEIYNVGSGRGSTVLQVVESFERVTGVRVKYSFAARRPGDVEAVYADVSKACQKLDWKCQRGLDDMTRTAWMWEKKIRNFE